MKSKTNEYIVHISLSDVRCDKNISRLATSWHWSSYHRTHLLGGGRLESVVSAVVYINILVCIIAKYDCVLCPLWSLLLQKMALNTVCSPKFCFKLGTTATETFQMLKKQNKSLLNGWVHHLHTERSSEKFVSVRNACWSFFTTGAELCILK